MGKKERAKEGEKEEGWKTDLSKLTDFFLNN